MSNGLWRTGLWRTRWAAIGAAVAVALGAGGLFTASAAISCGERTVYVPITPCRIMDTRPGQDTVGPRATPIADDDTHTIAVRGTNGECTLPADAVGVSLNVTALNSTSGSFLTVFPADVTRPRASSLNWQAGQAPTPNGVVADLSADGRLSFYNLAGTVDVIADVVGYYADHDHDDRYYTKQQVDAGLAGKANTADLAAKANTADVNAALAGKANSISGTPGTLVLGPAAFSHDGDGAAAWFIDVVNGEIDADGAACFAAPVALPNGATITSFTLSASDNDLLAVNARLRLDPAGPAVPTLMASLSTVDDPSPQVVTTGVIGQPVVSALNSYDVSVCVEANLVAYSATIGYTNP